jgi:hypothetical protein
MPTIQQLVRSRRIQIKKKQNLQHLLIVHNDAVFVQEFIQQHPKNQIQQFEKLHGFD